MEKDEACSGNSGFEEQRDAQRRRAQQHRECERQRQPVCVRKSLPVAHASRVRTAGLF